MNKLKSLFTLSLTALFLASPSLSLATGDASHQDTYIPEKEAKLVLAYLNTQGGTLKIVANVLAQMSALKINSTDSTKTPAEIEAYNTSFVQFRDFIESVQNETFLGTPLFGESFNTNATEGQILMPDLAQAIDVVFPEGLTSMPDLAQAIHEVTEATSLLEVTLEALIASEDNVINLLSQNTAEAKQLEEALQHAEA